MKYKITLYIGGKTFTETVQANTVNDAKLTAQARNTTAKIVALNPVF